jgi:hypothetical protein
MQKKMIAVFVGLAFALSLANVADAAKGGTRRDYAITGTIVDADGDDDALTAGPFVVEVTKAKGNVRRYLNSTPGPITVTVTDTTRFTGAAASAADIADGDSVNVSAKRVEDSFVARKVKEKAPEAG